MFHDDSCSIVFPDFWVPACSQVPHNKPESKYLGNDPLVEKLLSEAAQRRLAALGQWVMGRQRCCAVDDENLTLTMCKSNLERKQLHELETKIQDYQPVNLAAGSSAIDCI